MTDLSLPNPLTPYLAWIRIGLAAVAIAALLALGWRVHAWREAYKAYPELQERLTAEESCGEGSKCSARQAALAAAAEAKSREVQADYERELADLRNRPIPVRTVRLCPEGAAGDVRRADSAGPAHGAGPGAAVIPGAPRPNPDIGPELYELARDADEVAARLRALQEWNRALASSGK